MNRDNRRTEMCVDCWRRLDKEGAKDVMIAQRNKTIQMMCDTDGCKQVAEYVVNYSFYQALACRECWSRNYAAMQRVQDGVEIVGRSTEMADGAAGMTLEAILREVSDAMGEARYAALPSFRFLTNWILGLMRTATWRECSRCRMKPEEAADYV